MAFNSIRITPWILKFFIFFLLKADGRTANHRGQYSDYNQELPSKSAIKVVQTSSGDIYDCVDIYKQPSFDHPLLKDHILQMRPTSYPKDLLSENALPESTHESSDVENVACPEGSIPIIRTSGNGNQKMEWKDLPFFGNQTPNAEGPNEYSDIGNMLWAVQRTYIHDFYGTTADLNVYALPQVKRDQRSSSSIWITNKDNPRQSKFAFLSTGWHVYPEFYGDNKTRFFAAWTADDRQRTGCYDIRCPGFVATSKSIALGSILSPLSTFGGKQYFIRPFIYKDKSSGNWWLAFRDYANVVGYWPKELFDNFHVGRQVVYGGLVHAGGVGEPRPPMGNGHFPGGPNDKACFISGIKNIDYSHVLKYLVAADRYEDANLPDCYNVGPYDGARYIFRFGGDGACPKWRGTSLP